ncbi:hypothetical protein ACLBYD_22070 [Rhodococcus sp. C26F]
MRLRTVALVPAVALLLAACGGGGSENDATTASTAATESATAAPSPELIPLGTSFDAQDRNGKTLGTVTILDIEKNPVCTIDYGAPTPADGTYVAVQARVETPADYDATSFVRTTERDFSVITTDGVTKSVFVNSDLCIADRDNFDTAFDASSIYEGWVLLDTPDPNGTLVYRPQHSIQGPTYRVADLSTVRDSGGAPAPDASVVPTTTSDPVTTPPTTEAQTPAVAPAGNPPVGYTGAPIGDPQPLVGKTIDYCMDPSVSQTGTTQFTDGTTGWTQECSDKWTS